MIKIEYKDIISQLSKKIICDNLPHRNTVIIGDNSVGKTDLLKVINEKVDSSLFIECPYDKSGIDNISDNIEMVLLDNLETILGYQDIIDIMNFLDFKLKDKKIITVTHNLELVSKLKNFNLICIYNDSYAFCDGNDFRTYDDVRQVFNKKEAVDVMLSTLLNFKLSNVWTTDEQLLLEKIEQEKLTKTQEIMIREIYKHDVSE